MFKVFLHSWWKDAKPLILCRPPYISYYHLPFFKFYWTPHLPRPLTSLSPPTPIPTDFSIFLFLWLNRWSCHIWMHLHMSSLGTLVPEGPWCMFYATRHKFAEVWHIMCFYCTLIWYHTQTDKYKQHTQGYSRKTHPYIYKKWLFKKYSLVKVIYLLIRCYRTRFFLWNTNNTNRNRVNKQNTHTYTHTHTKQSEKDNTGKG